MERRVVTSLFCDLVGFTATSETADPEDVDRMLTAYFEIARAQIERHGGVVQKFIGDAVVGVFGVPTAHEDDPERAVRAGLRIVEDAERLQGPDGTPLRLRVGINSGETLVHLDVAPGSGDAFVTGDATNTASRIQSVAPQMGVAVGVATYEATSLMFDYEELEPETVKGKAQPVRVFHAKAPRARLGTDLTRSHDSPFIGREPERALLRDAFDTAVATNTVHLVTVTGEPGLGKTRLVAELAARLDDYPGLITWRQGRCLPYGEGITFWALGEIVKAHAGILDTDPRNIAAAKLEAVLPDVDERDWLRQQLAPLVGLEVQPPGGRAELFTAWRRFLESIAETGPTVLVFEDLHWAHEPLLEFIEHLAEHTQGLPLLLIGTARSELSEQHPDFATGLVNATTIPLAPLSEPEIARFVSALLGSTVLPAEVQQPILERVSGNPLFAEEVVRLLKDRNLLVRAGSSWQLEHEGELPLPVSVQGLIAARLDLLPLEAKHLLADAAVVGKVFWGGAVASMSEYGATEVDGLLRLLLRKELIRPVPLSSFAGETEYAFWHALTRDVAYAQLPRASRAARHVAAATWIESTASERIDDLADVLAYHYNTAFDLSRDSGDAAQTAHLEAPAIRFTELAGRRADGLDAVAALACRERAISLTPPGHPERARHLVTLGVNLYQLRRHTEATDALEEAVELCRSGGDPAAAASAMCNLSSVMQAVGDPRAWTLPAEALVLVEPLPASYHQAQVLAKMAFTELVQSRPATGLDYADRSLAVWREVEQRPRDDLAPRRGGIASPLGYRGVARIDLGDPGGVEDMRDAISLASADGLAAGAASIYGNLAGRLDNLEGPAAALEVVREGLRFARPRGLADQVASLTALQAWMLVSTGELEEASEVIAGIVRETDPAESLRDLAEVRTTEAVLLALQGRDAVLVELLDWLEPTCRSIVGEPSIFVDGFATAAFGRLGLGQRDHACGLLAELDATPGARESQSFHGVIHTIVSTAVAAGDLQLAERLATEARDTNPRTKNAWLMARAALSEGRGELRAASEAFADAAEQWGRFGATVDQAFALLGQGRCLVAVGEPGAGEPLREARVLFDGMGAHPYVDECDTLVGRPAQHTPR